MAAYFAIALLFGIFAFFHGLRWRIRNRGWLYGLTLGIFFAFLAAIYVSLIWPVTLLGLILYWRDLK